MRIKDELRNKGFFWLPANPEKEIPGELIISDGGKIELEVVGLFDESEAKLKNQVELNRINGRIENYGFVTLEDCFYKKENFLFGGISKSLIHTGRAILGVAYDQKEHAMFNSFRFSIDGIDEWVGLSGITVDRQFDKNTAIITYTKPSEVLIALNNGMNLIITFSWTFSGMPVKTEAKVTQKTHFKLEAEEKQPLKEFISIAHKITTLLCFAIDKTVSIGPVIATENDKKEEIGDGTGYPLEMLIYYPSLPFIKDIPKINRREMLFKYKNIKDRVENIFNSWLCAYDKFDSALNLYFSTKTDVYKYWDSKLLALAHGLEAYHRRTSNEKIMDEEEYANLVNKIVSNCPQEKQEWIAEKLKYANEFSLNSRIKSIIEPFKELFGKNKQVKKLIRNIVETRNYLTHYDLSLKTKAAKGKELWVLCLKAEAIFQLLLLKELGFPKEEIETFTENNWNLNHKLREI